MSRHLLGRLLGLSFALYLPLVACGADNDILRKDLPAPAPTNTDPSSQDPEPGDDQLDDADHLNSGGAADVSACPTPTMGAACLTTDADITANRAVVADHCGSDMSAMGFPGCAQLDQPGELDAACPEVTFQGAPPMPGCCTASGHCGAMETFVGFGCTSSPEPGTWVSCGG